MWTRGLGLRLPSREVQWRKALSIGPTDVVTGRESIANAGDVAFEGPVMELLTTFTIHARKSDSPGRTIGTIDRAIRSMSGRVATRESPGEPTRSVDVLVCHRESAA